MRDLICRFMATYMYPTCKSFYFTFWVGKAKLQKAKSKKLIPELWFRPPILNRLKPEEVEINCRQTLQCQAASGHRKTKDVFRKLECLILKWNEVLRSGGGGTPSVGCSYLRWAAPKNGEKWLGENIKTWIENRATLRHSMANLPSFLLHKLFLIYMLKFFTKVLPNFAKIFRMLGRIQFALYVRITYDRKVVYIRLVSQSTVGFLDFRL